MNRVNEFKKIWYKGERELATLNFRYGKAFERASTLTQMVRINEGYDRRKKEIETRRIEALKGLSA